MRASILFAACLFLFPVAAAQAGWQETSWGMSAAEVRAKYPDAVANTDRDNTDGELISTVTIPQYDVAGCAYRVNFWFQRGGGLAKVALYTPEGDRKAAKACYKSVRDLLTQKYGQPTGEKTSRPTRYTQQLDIAWKADDTAIGLHVADVPRAKKAFVSISYAPLAAPPAGPRDGRKL
ncbi:MAG: hypothetical protein JWM77_3430 [Rhodospirillales bacterium]|jgi:hypothetical protein|nr:hypothetical protein [Rhodospirillales bacterium]